MASFIKLLSAFAIIGALSSLQAAATPKRYFCKADASTGFFFEQGRWGDVRFKVEGEQYLVQELAEPSKFGEATYTWEVKKLGNKSSSFECRVNAPTNILCGGPFRSFNLNRDTLRYMEVYAIGYLLGDSNDDTPHITIGKCTPIE